jgi:hypothetical protein
MTDANTDRHRPVVAASLAVAVVAGLLAAVGANPAAAAESHRTSWAWADLADGRVTIGTDRQGPVAFPWALGRGSERESHDVTEVTAMAGGVDIPVGGTNWVAYGNDFEVSLTADDFWIGDRSSSAATAFLSDGVITATVDGVAGNTIVMRDAS